MKFIYEYRTRDNVHHEGVICASSREDAFSALRAQGIKPGSVREAPGFFNKLFGKGKRWIAIGLLGVLAVCGFCLLFNSRQTIEAIKDSQVAPMVRCQVYGDPALIEQFEKNGYAALFDSEGDRVLVRFACPGVLTPYIVYLQKDAMAKDAAVRAIEGLSKTEVQLPCAADSREAAELKRIVLWMRGELSAYLENGNGNASSYLRRLIERQMREAEIFRLAEVELSGVSDVEVWERRNAELRAIGLRTIPMPAKTFQISP